MGKIEKKSEYHFMWGQKQSAMTAEAMLLNFALYNKSFSITKGITDVMREHRNGFSHIYFSTDSIKKGFKNGKIYSDKNKTEDIFHRIDEGVLTFHKFISEVRDVDFGGLSSKEKIILVKKYRDILIGLQKLFRASDPSATDIIEKKIISILHKKVSEKESPEIFTALCSSVKLDKTQEEIIAWQKIVIDSKGFTDETLLKHALLFPAIFANVWSYEEIFDHLRTRMKETSLDELNKNVKDIYKNKKELEETQEKIYARFNDRELERMSKTLQDLGTTRFVLKHCWSGGETLLLPLLHKIALFMEISFDDFIWSYNFTDLLSYLEKGKKLTEKEIIERKRISIIHYKNKKLLYLFGDKADKYFKQRYQLNEIKNQELKGMVANRGFVKARARIVLVEDYEAFANASKSFSDGDILVTTMTSPVMMTLAKRASAIVTDEGGITSHAAVISREFNIPCVVGTHDATRIIKNGDIVEVDANKGIVKIVNK
jgi:phosphoenolpyruvate synthase/pyruvate phosphate dikinase